MKIINLKAENVMRLNAVEITPKGDTIIIGGKNEQGKTSVIESIVWALGGRKSKILKILKKGKDKGEVEIELDGTGLIIVRTINKAGRETLTVKSKEGAKFASPQAMLDKISGALTFDPLAWVGMDEVKQLQVLKDLTGVSFEAEDKLRAQVYETRTEANRKLKMLQTQMDALSEHGDDVPDVEMSVSVLMGELSSRQKHNKDYQVKADWVERLDTNIKGMSIQVADLEAELDALKIKLEGLKSDRVDAVKTLDAMVTVNEAEIETQIKSADAINRKVREKVEKTTLQGRIQKGTAIIQGMTDNLAAIDKAKEEKLSSAKMPIEFLTFDESGVYYKGVPFSQASSAEALRVSVAMGIAMNPELQILLIRNGSLLDEDNLKLISEMAFDSGHQLWLERVGEGEECSLIIHDGSVKEAR